MEPSPLTIEWDFVETNDSDTRLLEVFNLLISDEYLYEEQNEKNI